MKSFIDNHFEEYKNLIKELTSIPAPSFDEGRRVEYIKRFLDTLGVSYEVDDAKNVIVKSFVKKKEDIIVFLAHTDTVFPDTDKILVNEKNDRIYGPGVGDDTTNIAALLMVIKYLCIKKESIEAIVDDCHRNFFDRNVIFAFVSCEEGLGNLMGSKKLFSRYKDVVKKCISFDLQYKNIYNVAVGSKRFEINIKTEGGHSFNDFGNTSAIMVASDYISKIYQTDISGLNGKNTFNVGIVSGGTSVNTIAETASFLCEFRSDMQQSMEAMDDIFTKIHNELVKKYPGSEILRNVIGVRPSMGDVDITKQNELTKQVYDIIFSETGIKADIKSASTDCNVPLSMGIAAVCTGAYLGYGEHTRGEYVEISSLKNGLAVCLRIVMEIC